MNHPRCPQHFAEGNTILFFAITEKVRATGMVFCKYRDIYIYCEELMD